MRSARDESPRPFTHRATERAIHLGDLPPMLTDIRYGLRQLIEPSSFPNSVWERTCLRNSVSPAATELPGQSHSQTEFGTRIIARGGIVRSARDK